MDQETNRDQKQNNYDAYDLRAVFEELELDLIKNLRRNLKRHEREEEKEGFQWEMWQKAKLWNIAEYRKQNQEAVGKRSREIEELISKILQENYNAADNRLTRFFNKLKPFVINKKKMPPAKKEDDFFGVNERKIDAMQNAANISSSADAFKPGGKEKILSGKNNGQKLNDLISQVNRDMKDVQGAIWRRMDDIYRQTVYKAGIFMSSGAKTLDQAIDMATKDFLAGGIDCIQYKNGRRVNVASYAEMALRTASQRATFLAEGKKRDEWGIHTVFVSAHANTCPKCSPWQGKVLVDDIFSSGTAAEAAELGVPLLSTAMKAGLLHPNCRHTLATYFPGITTLPVVPNEDKSLKTYIAEQRQRALEMEIRKTKRKLAGACDDNTIRKAQTELKSLQKRLREHLEQHQELRRNYSREKTRDIPEKLTSRRLTLEEKGAVIRYISPSSILLNDKLRTGEGLTEFEKEWIMNLNKALDKLPAYKGDLNRSVTFQYDSDARGYFDDFVEGEGYVPNQYLSTTKRGVYNDSGEVQIYIQNAKIGKDLGELGIEDEVLYPIGSEFKVIYKTQYGGKYWVLLEEV